MAGYRRGAAQCSMEDAGAKVEIGTLVTSYAQTLLDLRTTVLSVDLE